MWWIILLFAVGLFLIIKGGDLFVDAAVWIAEVTGIPKFIIGATIVSLATTLPELCVSLISVASGSVGMGIGNAVGSVICNIGLIMALSLLFMPGAIGRRELLEKGFMMISSGAVLFFTAANGLLTNPEAIILLALVVLYIILNVNSVARNNRAAHIPRRRFAAREAGGNTIKFVLGLGGILWGAQLLVDNGALLARMAGISEDIIGLTLIALGTSLPELVTTLTALAKKEHNLSVGNIIGANIIDLTLILSACTFISPEGLMVSHQTLVMDIPVMMILMGIAIVPALLYGRFRRWQGVALVAVYGGYIAKLMIG